MDYFYDKTLSIKEREYIVNHPDFNKQTFNTLVTKNHIRYKCECDEYCSAITTLCKNCKECDCGNVYNYSIDNGKCLECSNDNHILYKYFNFPLLMRAMMPDYVIWERFLLCKTNKYVIQCDNKDKLPKDKYKRKVFKDVNIDVKLILEQKYHNHYSTVSVKIYNDSHYYIFEITCLTDDNFGFIGTGFINDQANEIVLLQDGHPVICTNNYAYYYSHGNSPDWIYSEDKNFVKDTIPWFKRTIKEIIDYY